jgi:hypothetical protein
MLFRVHDSPSSERGEKRLVDLKIGDMIKTSATADIFQPIYSFGHWDPFADVEFMQITTTRTMLELSSDQHATLRLVGDTMFHGSKRRYIVRLIYCQVHFNSY